MRAGVSAGWSGDLLVLLAEYGALISYTADDPASSLYPALAAGVQYVGGPVRPKLFWVRPVDREMLGSVHHSIGIAVEIVP